MAKLLYEVLASTIQARKSCQSSMDALNPNAVSASVPMNKNEYHKRKEWRDRHEDTIERLVKEFMPSGSGFDNGTRIDLDASHTEKLVFTTAYHHMNDGGYYDGWTDHTVTVTPSLVHEFRLRIGGRNRTDIKECIEQAFADALRTDVEWELCAPYVNINVQRHYDSVTGHTEYSVVTDSGGVLATHTDYEKAKAFAVEYVKAHREETRKVEVSA